MEKREDRRAALCLLREGDILVKQAEIIGSLSKVLSFANATLYFPADMEHRGIVYIAEEQKLILPLVFENKLVGAFLLSQVLNVNDELLECLPQFVELILENIWLSKQTNLDLTNGLSTNHLFYTKIDSEIAKISNAFAKLEKHFSSFVLTVIKIQNYKHIAKEYGYNLLEDLILLNSEKILNYLDSDSLATKLSENEIALFMPADALLQAKEKCAELQAILREISLKSPHSHKNISLELAFGYAHYPQDMDGTSYLHKNDSAWQSRVIMEKARYSAKYAANSSKQVLAYKNILQEAGRVQNVLNEEKLICNLGTLSNCFAGQRFSVWSNNIYKGEVLITESYDELSLADIIHWNDPLLHPQVGDLLRVVLNNYDLEDDSSKQTNENNPILNYRTMLSKLNKASQEHLSFQLVLIQMPADILDNKQLLDHKLELYTMLNQSQALFIGEYASNCLLAFYGDNDSSSSSDSNENLLNKMCELDKNYQANFALAIGIASYPYLHYKNTDMLDCVRKALEYALLLDNQKVGDFGSLAINISADKKLSQEDIFGAIEEYRHALLADPDNALAWNSLGVCMARLNKASVALTHFLEANKRQHDDISILYNIATTYQTLGQLEQAKNYFLQCLNCDPQNIYALLRLAQLEKESPKAKEYYHEVIRLDPTNPSPYRLLSELESDPKAARKFLHQAIQNKSNDALSLALLAKNYFQTGELSLSQSLAKQSLSLMPKNKIAQDVIEMIDKTQK